MRHRDTEDGASAVEYGLLVAGIAALIVLVVFSLGGVVASLFGNSCGTIRAEIESTSC
jgi:pilus assembly protein Flp/PilA